MVLLSVTHSNQPRAPNVPTRAVIAQPQALEGVPKAQPLSWVPGSAKAEVGGEAGPAWRASMGTAGLIHSPSPLENTVSKDTGWKVGYWERASPGLQEG